MVFSRAWTFRFLLTCLVQAASFALLVREPLFWAMHFEYALAASLSLVFLGGPWVVASFWEAPGLFQPAGSFAVAARRIFVLALLPLLLVLAAQKLLGTCDAKEGLAWYGLLPGVGMLFVAALGVLAAHLGSRRRGAYGWYGLFLFFFAAVLGARIYFGISYRSFNLLAGFWPGVLYDEYVPIDYSVLWGRLEALLLALGILLGLWSASRRACRLGRSARVGAILALAAFAGTWAAENRYLIHPTRGLVERALGIVVEGRHARWVVDRKAGAFLDQLPFYMARADYEIETLARQMEIEALPPITIYLFGSSEARRAAIGAEYTVITRPWRGELYLDLRRIDSVLRHEMVHLVASRWAYPGVGLSPNVAFLEGLAVDLAGDMDSLARPEGLSAAVLRAKPEFPLEDFVSGASFWGQSPYLAYPLAGAFVGYLRGKEGIDFRQAYRTGRLSGEETLPEAASEWRESLRRVAPTAREEAFARRILAAKPLQAKRCAHEVAQCLHGGGMMVWAGEEKTNLLVEKAKRLDPDREEIHYLEAYSDIQIGKYDEARKLLPEDPGGSEPPSGSQISAALRLAWGLLRAERKDDALVWFGFVSRWSSETRELWNATIGEALALGGGEQVIFQYAAKGGAEAWEVSCATKGGPVSCKALSPGETGPGAAGAVRQLEKPEIALAAAMEQERLAFASKDVAGARQWAGRMTQIEGLPEDLHAQTEEALLEARWIEAHYAEYDARVEKVRPAPPPALAP